MREQTKNLSGVLDFVGYFVGTVMAAGATLGAIGFGAWPVVLAVLTEAVLLVLPGTVLGVLAAWLLFNGNP